MKISNSNMKINSAVFENISRHGAHLVLVTKYFDTKTTFQMLSEVKNKPGFWALGENRVEALIQKKLPRSLVHFIGRIQTRKIPKIVEHASVVHSLDNIKYAGLLNTFFIQQASQEVEDGVEFTKKLGVFLQVNIAEESQKAGVSPTDFPDFLERVKDLSHLEILGISAMGAGQFTEASKRKEFQALKDLRDKFLPGKWISAGTSRDYEIATECGIEVVRVGQAAISL